MIEFGGKTYKSDNHKIVGQLKDMHTKESATFLGNFHFLSGCLLLFHNKHPLPTMSTI
jgi:hypothetical protein